MKTVNEKLECFDISRVSVTEPYLVHSLELETEYLLSLDADRWLAGFRETAGLDMKGCERYGGWENLLIGGHAFGHYLSACSQAYRSPDIAASDKEEFFNRLRYLMDELKLCQDNSKGAPGFIFGAAILDKDNVEKQFDNVEIRKTEIFTEAWVPWYTMHKVLQGIIDVYENTGYETALDVAKGLGLWTYNRASSWSEETHRTVLSTEYGGMNDCLYELYAITQDERFAVAAHAFDEEPLYERVKTGGENVLDGHHANTTIPKFLGALKRYHCTHGRVIEGKKVDASKYLEYAKAFFAMVRDRHTYITGGNSEWEHFGKDYVLDAERTNANNETCNVYNMLKLARLLFMITGDAQYADFYENAYINSIVSSQNPKTGMTTYFQAMATGFFKVYGEPYTKFWCCTGTGMENFTKLGDSIYFKNGNEIYVNMYISSVLKVDNELLLKQDSSVLDGGSSVFTVSLPAGKTKEVSLLFRLPDWASGETAVIVNGEKQQFTVKDGYALLKRVFADGDRTEVCIPMGLKAFPLPDEKTAVGFKYGPLVLSAGLGTEDMKEGKTGVDVTIPAEKKVESEEIQLGNGKTVDDLISDPGAFFTKDSDKPEFLLNGTKLKFTPHYKRHFERYGIYWYFK